MAIKISRKPPTRLVHAESPIQKNVGVKQALFNYEYPVDYAPTYINGAAGGICTQGEIVINFYVERQSNPISETVSVDGNKLGAVLSREPGITGSQMQVLRQVRSGIILNLEVAKRLYKFIGAQIEELEKKK